MAMQACQHQIMDCLLSAFGQEAQLHLAPPANPSSPQTDPHSTFLREASWRLAALEALRSWIIGYVSFLPQHGKETLSYAIAASLSPLLSLFTSSESRLPRDTSHPPTPPAVAHMLRMLQEALISVYVVLPCPRAFKAEWEGLVRLCLGPLRDGATWMNANMRRAVHCHLLLRLLNSQDAALAPYLISSSDCKFLLVRGHQSLSPLHHLSGGTECAAAVMLIKSTTF
jgi:hypothetical protein